MEVHENSFAVLSDLGGDCYDNLSSLLAKAAAKPQKATEKQKQQKKQNPKVARTTVSAADGFPSRTAAPPLRHVRPTEHGRGIAWNNDRWIGGRSNTGFVAFGKEETGTNSATNSGSSTRSMTNRNAGDFPENKYINQADCEDNKLTFAEYEKSIQEKKKEATEALKTEKRKVTAENQFEGMNLIGKKKEDDLHANMQKSGRNKGKRDGFEKEENMVYKTVSIGDIQIPIKKETGHRGGRHGGRGGNYLPK